MQSGYIRIAAEYLRIGGDKVIIYHIDNSRRAVSSANAEDCVYIFIGKGRIDSLRPYFVISGKIAVLSVAAFVNLYAVSVFNKKISAFIDNRGFPAWT
ncbi:hypothetical protein SDC9_169298 [bioreactor metagenome]|uniref:Uncharacterized protein n=1 Tax=bioreactor metagenome TaxID=1076179 RepID=A0A645G6Y4_9ZZZZ